MDCATDIELGEKEIEALMLQSKFLDNEIMIAKENGEDTTDIENQQHELDQRVVELSKLEELKEKLKVC